MAEVKIEKEDNLFLYIIIYGLTIIFLRRPWESSRIEHRLYAEILVDTKNVKKCNLTSKKTGAISSAPEVPVNSSLSGIRLDSQGLQQEFCKAEQDCFGASGTG
jgi:hypothetical protein